MVKKLTKKKKKRLLKQMARHQLLFALLQKGLLKTTEAGLEVANPINDLVKDSKDRTYLRVYTNSIFCEGLFERLKRQTPSTEEEVLKQQSTVPYYTVYRLN